MFDGDEMNMFIPQSVQTQLELANIADVKRQIITPRYSRPIIKFKQDTVLGTYKMTEGFKKINFQDAMNLSMYCNGVDMFKIKKSDTNTHDIYSMIIPQNINFTAGDVVVNNGKIVDSEKTKSKGVMGDSILNQKIIYYSWDRHGPDQTKNFFDNAQRLVTNWLLMNGFTVGLGDATTDQSVIDDIKSFCEIKQMEVDKLITEMENNPDTLDPETFESNILSTLKASDGEITKRVFEHLKKNQKYNNFFVMIESKAKGSQGNIGQIIGGLGQNVLEFRRIKKKVNNRTLPHFFQNDDRAFARGFIPNSYYHGLTPKEFFFHHMTAREGMIDTAIKSVTGDTPIVILENGVTKHVKIGDWIDQLLQNNNNVQIDASDTEHREMLAVNPNIYIPTTDLDGKIKWGQITHITRHNPSAIMYEIKTSGGRNVTVTDSHSLLIWNTETKQFERKSAHDIAVGSFVPVSKNVEPFYKSTNNDNLNLVKPFESIEKRDLAILEANKKGIYLEIDQINPLKLNHVDVSKLKTHNDVVLEYVTEINQVDPSLYAKVYDLTVPSTLNFGLANGLHVVDTADSGYLQRKLIKGMEDVMITYDKTVRSGNNVLMQMIYGDNGINQTHYKEVELRLVNMGNKEIESTFCFTSDEVKKMCTEFKLSEPDFNAFNKDLKHLMIKMRDELRTIQMKARMNYITMQSAYQLPVNMNRIIDDAKNFKFNGKSEQPSPLYIMHTIHYILRPDVTKINITNKDHTKNKIKYGDQERAKFLFKISLLEYLNPRRCIYEYGLSKSQFDQMVVEIVKSFRKACVEPGEMVGVLTAQSLGETLTQMSIVGNTDIMVKCESKITGESHVKKMSIGELIDNIYKEHDNYIINIPNHIGSTEFDLSNLTDNYYICGVDQNEKIKWNKISHFSRHPTNGNLLKIKTKSGRTITSTKSHNFLKRTQNGIVAVTSENLSVKDRIPVARNIEYQSNKKDLLIDGYKLSLSNNMGWLFGAYLAEGNVNYHEIGISKILTEHCNKHVPEFAHNANIDFVKGLLKGYFDRNENVAYDRNIIRVASSGETLIDDIIMLLRYLGIFASKYVEKKSNNTTSSYCLGIPHKYARKFLESVGSDVESKKEEINKIIQFSESENQYNSEVIDKIPELGHIIAKIGTALKMPGNSRTYSVWQRRNMSIGRRTLNIYIERFKNRANEIGKMNEVQDDILYLETILNGDIVWDEISEIIELDDTKEYVYDFTIPKNETFMVYDGIIVHNTLNTFHSTGVGVKGMQGIPRFREILSFSKNIQTPYMIIKMVPEVRADQNIAHKIEAYLKHTIFGNLIERMDIIYDPIPKNTLTNDKINTSNIYYVNGGSVGLDNLPWLYKFTISRESMLENDIYLLDIKTKFIKYWEEYQNDSSANKKKIILSRVTNGCIISNFDNSEPPVVHIRFDINNPDNYTLVEIGQFLLNKISIKGVATIEKVDRVDKQKVIEYDNDGAIKPIANEWVIYTTGIDLNKIKTIKHIDFESVYLNDIYMTYLNFGIEAARNLILRETDNLYNGSGNPLNVTHLALLADVMTNTGNITSIDRHGINRLDTDPLSRASFEKTVEQLLLASAFNEVDYMRSVSSRIMAGRCIKGGTGLCEVMLDNDLIENSEYGNQASYITTGGTDLEVNPQIEEITKMVKDKLEDIEHFDMFMP